MEIRANSELPVTWNNGCTEARCISKGSYGEGQPENVNLALVQWAHRPGRACKLLRFMHRGIGPSMEICANSELPVARYNGCTEERCI